MGNKKLSDPGYPALLKKGAAIILGALLLGGCTGQPPATDTAADFARAMRAYAQDYFELRPELALFYGAPHQAKGATHLSHYDPRSEQARRAGLKTLLGKIENYPTDQLNQRQRLSVQLIKTNIKNALAPSELVRYGSVLGEYGNWFLPYPVSHLSGPHVEVPTILEDNFLIANADDASAYIARLREYARILDGVIEKIQHDRELGAVPPDFVLQRTAANLSALLGLPLEETPLIRSFAEKLTEAGVDDAEELQAAAVNVMREQVNPATTRLRDTLVSLQATAATDAGVWRLPNGSAWYQAMITHLTDTTLTAQHIHDLGLSEVARIHGEMDLLLKEIGYQQGTVGQRMAKLLADPQYIYPNTAAGKAQLIADMRADLELVNKQLPQWFGKLPDQDVLIKAVPAHREQAVSGAFYNAPSQDGSAPGTFWISLYDTAANPSYSLQTLTYHEANPGHHLQTVIGLADDLPLLNTIFYSNAAGEGWGLYAEQLAQEMGVYANDPVDDLGRLQAELHRAVRLVVDTGMHALRWSRQQAIDYSLATEGSHVDEATSEIERYSVWPGQALGYKLGQLKIVELRGRAQEQLGDKFDIRDFHDRVLEEGSLPLNILEQKIDGWIGSQQ